MSEQAEIRSDIGQKQDRMLLIMRLAKENQIAIFEDTQNLIRNNRKLYKLTKKAMAGTVLYNEGFRSSKRPEYRDMIISVVEQQSFAAAKTLCSKYKHVAVLNFASAVNPGGGVTIGAVAQEECLCRISNLYPCLVQQHLFEPFYQYHRNLPHKNYSDRIIYSRGITVFKTDTDEPGYMEKWYSVDVITSPAPNLIDAENPDLDALSSLFVSRIRNILETAMENGVKALVLGAFGCGAFRNSPKMVSEAFMHVLEREGYKKHFKEVVFAIKRKNDGICSNLMAFEMAVYGLSEEMNKLRFTE